MSYLMQKRDPYFFVDRGFIPIVFPSARQVDDTPPKEVNLRRQFPRGFDGLLGLAGARMQSADRQKLLFTLGIQPQVFQEEDL